MELMAQNSASSTINLSSTTPPTSQNHQIRNSHHGRKLWGTSRERDRLKARFQIKSRILNNVLMTPSLGPITNKRDGNEEEKNYTDPISFQCKDNHQIDIIPFFRSIEANNCSAFGICKLDKLATNSTLDALHETSFLDKDRIHSLCVSRFGRLYARHVLSYLERLGSPTLISHHRPLGVSMVTYAALLGQYQVLGCLLLGGANPIHPPTTCAEREKSEERFRTISSRVLTRFFHYFPVSYKAGITRRIVEMRLLGFLSFYGETIPKQIDEEDEQFYFEGQPPWNFNEERDLKCQICDCSMSTMDSPLLNWGGTCCHSFCEYCCWENIIDHIDARDSIVCPVCQADRPIMKIPLPSNVKCEKSGPSCTSNNNISENTKMDHKNRNNQKFTTPYERKHLSLHKFHQLPLNIQALKNLKHQRKRKCPKNVIHFSWSSSIYQNLGKSQDIRREKFFAFVAANSIPHVRGCLEAGVNVDDVNCEYHQTNLYIACWMGLVDMVQLLLKYGADSNILANGGLSCKNVAEENGFHEIVHLLDHFASNVLIKSRYKSKDYDERDTCKQTLQPSVKVRSRFCTKSQESDSTEKKEKIHTQVLQASQSPKTVILIDSNSSHPGAGSCYIDNALSESHIENLVQLCKELPVEEGKIKSKEKQKSCSVRSYFCDAEGFLCELIAAHISPEHFVVARDEENVLKPVVLSHMRFLSYHYSGSSLPPHVDLCRLDRRYNKRSTHTFLLYLTDCDKGGETILLKDVAGDGREVIMAKVTPKRGRLLLFPHLCPHEGAKVRDVPKLLLRGEVMFINNKLILNANTECQY